MTTVVWTPKHPEASRMWHFMRFIETNYQQDFSHYNELYSWSIDHPELFWPALCDYFEIRFDTPPLEIINHYTDMLDARWFTGARFNFAKILLSRKDDHPALISIDEQDRRLSLTYNELEQHVAQCAAGLKAAGIVAGDRVGAIMPNIAKTVIAMLATTSLGAVWSSCSPDFGATAIIDRLGQIQPKLLFASDGHQYQGKIHEGQSKLEEICAQIPSIAHLVICPFIDENPNFTSMPKAQLWNNFIRPSTQLEFISLPFSHPLYILFSSGTTGKPKCIVHSAGGTLLQHLKELGLHTDIKSTDNLCFYTTCGWMMWNWMVSTLALGATLTLYEGSPTFPDASRLFQLIEEEKVSVFGTSAKFISTVEKEGVQPGEAYSLSNLRCILSTGSPLLPKNYDYVYQSIKPDVQLCSISGGTDIVSCFALGNPLLPVYRGELQCLGLGIKVDVFNEKAQSIRSIPGELVCTQAFPAMPIGFWHDPDNQLYRRAYFEYFPGVWAHGDFAEITSHGGLIIYGRSDTVLNPGGVRIGTAEIYRQIEKIPQIMDSVVISQDWHDDVRIVLFVKLKHNIQLTETLENTIRKTIRQNTSPRHVPAKILQVTDIPRTMNGKIVEIAIRQTVHGQPVRNLQSLANPEALLEFAERSELQND